MRRAPLASLREALEESTIPNRVDVVNLAETDAVFRDQRFTECLRVKAASTVRDLAGRAAPSKIERDAMIQRFEAP